MVWSNNDNWMVTGDHGGFVKYWQSNMNNVKMFQAHKEPIRGIRYFSTFYLLHISGGQRISIIVACSRLPGLSVRGRTTLKIPVKDIKIKNTLRLVPCEVTSIKILSFYRTILKVPIPHEPNKE